MAHRKKNGKEKGFIGKTSKEWSESLSRFRSNSLKEKCVEVVRKMRNLQK